MLVGNLGYVDPEYANHATLLYVKPHPLSQFFLFSCLTASAQRPTMTDVVAQLQECLQLEEARATAAGDVDGSGSTSDPYSGYNAYAAAADGQSSAGFEVEHNFGRASTMPTGPAAR